MTVRWGLVILAAIAAILLAAPFWAAEFTITLLNYIGIYALVALGVVLLTGVGGLTSFGQAAFVGIGAYATAWLTTAEGASPWLGLLFALALSGIVAALLGAITLRLGGHFLPLGTIAWGLSIFFLFGNLETLGRNNGIGDIPPITIGPLSLAPNNAVY
jgi:branched-chain amino acid transport system permease protein